MPNPPADITVTRNAERNRFEVTIDGKAAFADYMDRGKFVVFPHTEVPSSLEGRGIGSALAETALEWARAEGKEVMPLCPFFKAFIRKNPEYQELVMERFRGR